MKTGRTLFIFIFLTTMVLLDVNIIRHCNELASLHQLLAQDTLEKLRAQEISLDAIEQFQHWEKKDNRFSCYEYLCAAMLTKETQPDYLRECIRNLKKYKPEEFAVYIGYLQGIWADLKWFPIPRSSINAKKEISFGNSWMAPRTFGGSRGHEGTDLMAAENKRGRYPVVSMTDGVVEQIGWLTKGGYRLGIRSPHGGYFYYAHLYDYARDFQPGDTIKAGELIGFMGDSGYSEIEGTVGNFDVHLHLGIYVNQPDGSEISFNSFLPLKYLEERRLIYQF